MGGGCGAITVDKILPLERHPVLDGDTPAKCAHPFDIARRDGFRMIEYPVQAIERNLAIHFFKHVQHAADRLVIGGMQAKRPAVRHQMPHHFFQFVLHACRQLRPRLQEVFKVCRRKHQHFTRAVMTIKIVAVPGADHVRPFLEILQFLPLALGEQVIGDADSQLLVTRQLVDDGVVFGIILKSAAGIDGAGDAEPVQFAHELAGRVDLLLARQCRTLGQGGVQDHCIRPGDQHASRIASRIALDLAAGRIRRVLGVAHSAQGGAIEQGTVIQVQDKHWRVRCSRIDFFQGRHALFSKLEFTPAADHTHPLRMGRSQSLFLQHAQGICQ